MLISRIITLIRDGYEGLPAWYLLTLGWGSLAFMALATAVLTRIRWRSDPDDFTPWPDVAVPTSSKGVTR